MALELEGVMGGERPTTNFQPGVAAPAAQVFEMPASAVKGTFTVQVSGTGGEFGVIEVGG